MAIIAKLTGWAGVYLPSRFLETLDLNLQRLNEEEYIVAITQDGYTLKVTDAIRSLQVNATSGNKTIYLPPQPNGNRHRRIIKTDSSANTVTINGNGSLINGAATYVLAAQYDKLDVEPTGTGWLVVN